MLWLLYSNSVFLDTVPATIETNKILAPFRGKHICSLRFWLFVPHSHCNSFWVSLQGFTEICELYWGNNCFSLTDEKKKKNSGGKSGSKCTEGIYCTEQANKYRCSCFNTMYRCISWRCTSGYWRLDLTQTLSDIDWTARVCGDATFLFFVTTQTHQRGLYSAPAARAPPPGSGLKVVFKEGFITSQPYLKAVQI